MINLTAKAKDLAGLIASKSLAVKVASGAWAWPDASNTGVPPGMTLTSSGSITTSAHGQVIRLKNFSGSVTVNHNNVLIEFCKFRTSANFPIRITPGRTGCVIRDVEIDNMGAAGSCAINGTATVQRVNIHDTENGWNFDGGPGALWEYNYIHDLRAGGSPHYDGMQIDGSASDIIIRRNTIINPWGQTAAIMIDNFYGPVSNVLVEENRLIGGGYTVYSDGHFNSSQITGVKFINNRLGKGGYGYRNFVNNSPLWTGNVDDVTGNPI